MPRGAWLALGALGAALLAALVGAGPWTVAMGLASLVGVPVAGLLAVRQRTRQAALLVGVATIGLRLAIGGLTAPAIVPAPTLSRTGHGWHRCSPLARPTDGKQRAVLLGRRGRGSRQPRVAVRGGSTRGCRDIRSSSPPTASHSRAAWSRSRQDGSEFADYLTGSHIAATSPRRRHPRGRGDRRPIRHRGAGPGRGRRGAGPGAAGTDGGSGLGHPRGPSRPGRA